jgi:dTDP-4-dehydrorhamnose 3,5-epimerase-like enzyme
MMSKRMSRDKNYVDKKGSIVEIVKVQEFHEQVRIKRKEKKALMNHLNIINGKSHRKKRGKKNDLIRKLIKICFIMII